MQSTSDSHSSSAARGVNGRIGREKKEIRERRECKKRIERSEEENRGEENPAEENRGEGRRERARFSLSPFFQLEKAGKFRDTVHLLQSLVSAPPPAARVPKEVVKAKDIPKLDAVKSYGTVRLASAFFSPS